jgi:cytochrome b involved in lipid metabolism
MAIDFNEIKKHNDKRSCWVVVYGKIYDVTEFLSGMYQLNVLLRASIRV